MSDTENSMQEVARRVEACLPPFTGFVVLAFDFNQPQGSQVHYVSNAKREDVLNAGVHRLE